MKQQQEEKNPKKGYTHQNKTKKYKDLDNFNEIKHLSQFKQNAQ